MSFIQFLLTNDLPEGYDANLPGWRRLRFNSRGCACSLFLLVLFIGVKVVSVRLDFADVLRIPGDALWLLFFAVLYFFTRAAYGRCPACRKFLFLHALATPFEFQKHCLHFGQHIYAPIDR